MPRNGYRMVNKGKEEKPLDKNLRYILRFLIIGMISVTIDYYVYNFLHSIKITVHLAKGFGYIAGMIFGFVGNKVWTFQSSNKPNTELPLYVIIYACTFGVNIGVNALFLDLLNKIDHSNYIINGAFLVSTGMSTILNFLGMRFIVFRKGIQQLSQRNKHRI